MIVLLGFALLAGAGTALSPCVLPVLPAMLSASGVGGRRRPVGIVIGLSVTFTVTIVGAATVVDGVGLGTDPLRALSVVVLLVFGLSLLIPSFGARLEAPLSRLARFGPKTKGDGFFSGLLVGAALGFVYTPCAGPILAAVISVGAATGRSVAVAIAYSIGSALTLLVLCLGGRKVFDRVRAAGRGPWLQRILGGVMVLTAVAITTNLDVNFDQLIAEHIPNVSLTASLEKSSVVTDKLPSITGHKPKFVAATTPATPTPLVGAHGKTVANGATGQSGAQAAADEAAAPPLPDLGNAPDFTDTQQWFNTPGDKPLTLASLRGRVVLVDFWTYTCINCIRTLPYLKAWDARYRNQGLTIVGVETPEFQFEHEASNVENAIHTFGIKYPVVQDNNYGTWNAYGNQYWPADYLIDGSGQVRYTSFGEGDYDKTESAIRALLAEAGHAPDTQMAQPKDVVVPSNLGSPETYLGTERAQGWVTMPVAGLHSYTPPSQPLQLNDFAYGGTWSIAGQPATAVSNASIEARFQAKNVYLVLSSKNNKPRQVQVSIDGQPIHMNEQGSDVHDGLVTVSNQRLYTLVSLPNDQQHTLTPRFAPGVTGYAFTFG